MAVGLFNFYSDYQAIDKDCVKSVRIRSFSGSYFLTFGLNTERYCGKIRARKFPNMKTFYAVKSLEKGAHQSSI